MSNLLIYFPAIVCAGVAAGLASKGQGGWGWFLFAAVLICGMAVSK